jgi:hypothetical protein
MEAERKFAKYEVDSEKAESGSRFAKYEVGGSHENERHKSRFSKYEVDHKGHTETLSIDDYVDSRKNESNAVTSFFEAGADNLYDYAASINKALGMNEGAEFWNRLRRKNEVEGGKHEYARLAGSMLLDPVNLTPAGIVSKGSKAARIAKSAAAGAGIGAATTAFHQYGRGELSAEHLAAGTGIVGGLNALIAAATRGKVKEAIKSADDLNKPEVQETIRSAAQSDEGKAWAEALANNPEAFGLKRAEADATLAVLKDAAAPQELKAQSKEAAQAAKAMRRVYAGELPHAEYGDVRLTGGQKRYGADKIEAKHGEPHQRGFVNAEEKYGIPFQIDRGRMEADERGTTYITEGFDGADIKLGTRNFGGKEEIVTLHSSREPERRGLPLLLTDHPDAGAGWPSPRFSSRRLPEASGAVAPTDSIAQNAPDFHSMPLDELKNDPLFSYVVERAKSRSAKDVRYDRVSDGPRTMKHSAKNGEGWTTEVYNPAYAKNYESDFTLTKSDAARIERGEITPEIEAKIRQDMATMVDHPEWAEEGRQLRDEAFSVFANGGSNFGHHLAGGFAGGTYNTVSGEYDPNRPLDEQVAEKFLQGMAYGALGVAALKQLRRVNPKAFERVQKVFIENDIKPGDDLSVKLGVFAGSKAKGFKAAKESGEVFPGRYDNMERFEIIDDAARVNEAAIPKPGGVAKMGEVLDHPALYENYPQLRDVEVKIDPDLGPRDAIFRAREGEHGTIYLPEGGTDRAVILHELQHKIQDIEGFARGNSVAYHKQKLLSELDRLKRDADSNNVGKKLEAMQRLEEIERKGIDREAFERYQREAGEIEAREVEQRLGFDDVQRMIYGHGDIEGIAPEDAYLTFKGGAKSLDAMSESMPGASFDKEALEAAAVPEPKPISLAEFVAKFSKPIETPIGELRLDTDYYLNKAVERDGGARIDTIHLIEPTLKEPAYVVKYRDAYNFIKPFVDPNDRVKKFLSVVSDRDGNIKIVSAYRLKNTDIKNILKNGEVIVDNVVGGATPAGRGSTGSRLAQANPESGYSIPDSIAQNDDGIKLGMFAGDAPRGRAVDTKRRYSHFHDVVTRQFEKEWGDLSRGFKNEIKRLFTNTLSGDYMKKRDMVKAGRAEAIIHAERLQSALKQLPEADRKTLHEYIVGDIDDAPQHLKQIAENVRTTVQDIGRELVNSGVMPQEAVDAWGKYYLRRLYDRHYKKGMVGDMVSGWKQPAQYRRGKVEEMTLDELRQKIESGELDPSKFNDIGADGGLLEPRERIALRDGGIDVEALPNGRVRITRDWTKAEREEMGEITDAAITIPETILQMKTLLNNARFLKEVASVDGAVVLQGEAKKISQDVLKEHGYTKLGTDSRYGVLAGQWVRKDVADDIEGLNDRIMGTFYGNDGEVAKAWQRYLSLWKKSKTVWNLPTHLNNFLANPFIMNLAGMGPVEIGKRISQAGKMMLNGKRFEQLETKAAIGTLNDAERAELAAMRDSMRWYKEAKEQGILNTSVLEDIRVESDTRSTGKLAKLDERLTNAYQNEDGISKLAMYMTLREAGFAKDEARRATLSILPDYSDPMPKGWRIARDTGITPFIAWSYYTYPKMMKLLGTKRGAFNAAVVLGGLEALSYAMTGEHFFWDDSMPEDFQGKRLPVAKDGREITTYKIDKQIPYLQFFAPLQTAREFVYQGVPQTAVSLSAGVKLWNQRPITNKYKPKAQQVYDYLKYGTQGLTPIPGSVSSGWDFIEGVIRSKRNRKTSSDIVPRNDVQNILKMLGLNTLTYDKVNAEKKNKKLGTWW